MEENFIKKNSRKPEALDYQRFRQYGLDYIVKMGSNLWNDYNIHDPGITVLELLCYALTDLGYRTSFDMKDILTPPEGRYPEMKDAFIPAHEILPCHPLTQDDYCKWILEHIPCIRNVWLDTCDHQDQKIKGLYRIRVDMYLEKLEIDQYIKLFGRKINGRFCTKEEYLEDLKNERKYCRSYIRNMFLKKRNLCEDVDEVVVLKHVDVGICANIEIKQGVKCEPIVKEIGKRMSKYINPAIRYYTLAQMLEKGKPVEEIFQGYVNDSKVPMSEKGQRDIHDPKYGFIDKDELDRFKTQLNNSDAINLIMSIEGVLNVRHFHFVYDDTLTEIVEKNDYSIKLRDGKDNEYSFCFCCNFSDEEGENSDEEGEKPAKRPLNHLIFTQGLLSFPSPKEITVEEIKDPYIKYLDVELPLPEGNNRELDQYISIQDEFPKTYKMGKEGIADSETDLRKAQRLQYKAYLLFFDQLLADYLSQLNSVKDILSWREGKDRTYLFKKLSDEEITDFSKVFSEYKRYNEDCEEINYGEIIDSKSVRLDRKNRFLNHLIARFNEQFVDYSIHQFQNLEKGKRKKCNEDELIADEDELIADEYELISDEDNLIADEEKLITDDEKDEELIIKKKTFLRNYVSLSRDRSRAFDYTEPYHGGTGFFFRERNVCGLEAVLYSKLGLNIEPINHRLVEKMGADKGKSLFFDNRTGSYKKHFGLRVFEHILMRPLNGFLEGENQIDPYSMQITVAVPGWLRISENPEFRKFVEKMILTEIPPHIVASIYWLNPCQMCMLETKYEKFLSVLAKYPYLEDQEESNLFWKAWGKKYTKSLRELEGIIFNLKSMHPHTRFNMCTT